MALTCVVIIWPFAQIGLIVAQVQHLAGERAYCIEISGGRFGSYTPVASLLELNGFNLRAPFLDSDGSLGLAQWTFHALVVIDTGSGLEWRNWSYWRQRFDRLTPEQVKAAGIYSPACELQANFVWQLPLVAER